MHKSIEGVESMVCKQTNIFSINQQARNHVDD